jgi:hypothetical protein
MGCNLCTAIRQWFEAPLTTPLSPFEIVVVTAIVLATLFAWKRVELALDAE